LQWLYLLLAFTEAVHEGSVTQHVSHYWHFAAGSRNCVIILNTELRHAVCL